MVVLDLLAKISRLLCIHEYGYMYSNVYKDRHNKLKGTNRYKCLKCGKIKLKKLI